jgi:hypothetical protein
MYFSNAFGTLCRIELRKGKCEKRFPMHDTGSVSARDWTGYFVRADGFVTAL